MKHLTKKQLTHLIKEEKKDSVMYKRLGMAGIAAEEKHHENFLRMLKRKRR